MKNEERGDGEHMNGNGTTDDGRPVTVTLNAILQWVMGISATLSTLSVVWLVTTVNDVKETQAVMQMQQQMTESNRFRQEDWIRESGMLRREFAAIGEAHVTLREFTAFTQRVENQLDQIQRSLDSGRNQ